MSKKKQEEVLENSEQEVIEEEKVQEQEEVNEVEEEVKAEEKRDPKDERIEELESELAITKDSMLRKAAELENVRKRIQKERFQLREQVKAEALEDFLPLNDDLLRTLDASKDIEVEKNFLAGVEMVSAKFTDILTKYGVQAIDEINVPFDVNVHDALLRQPAPDEKTGSDVVLQVLERGYRMGERVIKHAKVIVSQ